MRQPARRRWPATADANGAVSARTSAASVANVSSASGQPPRRSASVMVVRSKGTLASISACRQVAVLASN